MNTRTIISIISLSLIFVLLTGFQCGSAESTSAKLYMQRGEWDAAETSLMKEVENNPTNGEAWYFLGQVRLRKGEKALDARNYAQTKTDFSNMLNSYNKSLESTPEFQDKIVNEKICAWQKSLNAGVELFNNSLKAPEDQAKTLRSQAVEMYDLAIVMIPDSLLPYKNITIALGMDGLYEQQLPYLQKARTMSNDVEIMTSLIQYYVQKGDDLKAAGDDAGAMENYNLAIAEMKEARKADDTNPDILNAMIDTYIKTDRAAEAIPLMKEGLTKDPGNRDYHYNLGVLLMQEDKLAEAITHFDAALEADPDYDIALQNAGSANLKLADEMKRAAQSDDVKGASGDRKYVEVFKKAAGYFERLSKLKPEDPNVWDFLGSAYANAGMLKEAEAAIQKADELRK